MERQFEKVLSEHGVGKTFQTRNVYSLKGLFLSVYVDDIKLAGKQKNIDPMWKILMKDIDLEEPTSFLDHVYLRCTQRECQANKDIVDNFWRLFESRISAGAIESCLILRNLAQTFLHGPTICKFIQRNAWTQQ